MNEQNVMHVRIQKLEVAYRRHQEALRDSSSSVSSSSFFVVILYVLPALFSMASVEFGQTRDRMLTCVL